MVDTSGSLSLIVANMSDICIPPSEYYFSQWGAQARVGSGAGAVATDRSAGSRPGHRGGISQHTRPGPADGRPWSPRLQRPPPQTVHAVLVSGGREPPPPALAGPDVRLSPHPAPTGRPLVCGSKYQWAKRRGWCCRTAASQAPALVGLFRSRLNFCIAHRTRCWSMRNAKEYNSER